MLLNLRIFFQFSQAAFHFTKRGNYASLILWYFLGDPDKYHLHLALSIKFKTFFCECHMSICSTLVNEHSQFLISSEETKYGGAVFLYLFLQEVTMGLFTYVLL